DENILYYATTTSCSFKPQTDISTNECTVAYINISCATAHFATNYKTTMRSIYSTTADNNIFNWHSSFSSFCITSTFHAQCIIANIKYRVFNQYVLAALCIYSITILCIPGVFYKNISHR